MTSSLQTRLAEVTDPTRLRYTSPTRLRQQSVTATGELRATDEDKTGRTVTGVAVPYGVRTVLYEYDGRQISEEFAPEACEPFRGVRTLLYESHRTAIGRVTEHEHTTDGWVITAPISRTSAGDDALVLVQDEVLSRMSVGFRPREWTRTEDEDGNVHIVITRAEVLEVSLVPHPAYEDTPITGLRHHDTTPKEHHMTASTLSRSDLDALGTDLRAQIDGVSETVTDVSRRLDTLPTTPVGGEHRDQYGSVGHFLKRAAAGDEEAIATYGAAFARDFEGGVVADGILKETWVGDLTEIIKKLRPITEIFASGTLPDKGMTVEYGYLDEDTTQVGRQATEGANLPFGKVKLATANAHVETYGGYTELSVQAIERTNIGVLDTTMEALAEKYGQATEARTRQVLKAAYDNTGTGEGAPPALATVPIDWTTQDGVVGSVLDLAEHYTDTGRSLDGILVDKATFLALYGIEANKRILQIGGAPADKVGTITIETARGDVAGLEFRLLPKAAAGFRLAYDKTAIKKLESPGAPWRLQDGNIINLTRSFSLYGYLASFVQKRAGLVKLTQG